MKNLNELSTGKTYSAYYRDIVASGRDAWVRASLHAIQKKVTRRYARLELLFGDDMMHRLGTSALMQRNELSLRDCYEKKRAALRTLLADIKSAQEPRALGSCPYCGITIPRTNDHYFPAAQFPEYSVHGLNLIPCCIGCNQKKGDRWKDKNGRMFLHLMVDFIPSAQYLFTTLHGKDLKAFYATFELRRPANVLLEDWRLVEAHYENLELLERFSDASTNWIPEIFNICVSHMRGGGGGVGNFLRIYLNRESRDVGNNHWKVSLHRRLAMSVQFANAVLAEAL